MSLLHQQLSVVGDGKRRACVLEGTGDLTFAGVGPRRQGGLHWSRVPLGSWLERSKRCGACPRHPELRASIGDDSIWYVCPPSGMNCRTRSRGTKNLKLHGTRDGVQIRTSCEIWGSVDRNLGSRGVYCFPRGNMSCQW